MSLFHNPAPPATISTHPYHNHPPSLQPQTTTGKKKKKKLHIQSHKIKESSKSKNHKTTPINLHPSLNHLEQPTPSTQNHPDQPTNPATEIKNPPKSIKTTEIKTHQHQNCKTHSPDHHRNSPRTTIETHDP